MPTLEAALALCAELGLGINVEIKPCPGREVETARVAVAMLRGLWPGDRPAPLISSFAPACLGVARDLAPEMPRGYLAGSLPRRWREELTAYGCRTLHLSDRRLAQRSARRCWLPGCRSCSTRSTIRPARDTSSHAGVTAVFTDRVGEVLAALD